MKTGIVLFAHGSRDADWARPFERIGAHVARMRPDALVSLAFLESMTPSLPEAVDALIRQGALRITIVPLFLGAGGHVKIDLPRSVAQMTERYPQTDFTVLSPIGDDDRLLEHLAAWAAAAAPT
jgi:sirohydrochlorin cobaltochelatase